MRLKTILLAAIAGAVIWSGPAQSDEADPVRGEQIAATCMGCHAVQGSRNAYPSYRVPRIGGQNAQYMVDALKAYQAGTRNHPTMRAQAANLTEQDMRDISAYFSEQK